MEIKFRGKNILNDNWVYGYYFVEDGIHKIHSGHTIYPIKFKTLGQYLNLKDSENIEIYDGDLLDFDEREWGGKFKPEVIRMSDILGEWNLCGSKSDLSSWRKVIGNIH